MKNLVEKIPIFLSADNNYAPFVATTMASILDYTKSFIEFYILDAGISAQNKEKITSLKNKFNNFSIEFIELDPEKCFENFSTSLHLSISTYNRLMIPVLKPNLNKILYLDVDVVVLGEIAELYNVDLENYALGAAWDKSRVLYNTDTKEPLELSDNYKYFNAGILLMDVQKWRQEDIVKKLFEIQKKYADKILHVDETLLNKYFDGNYKIFDIAWNYTDYDVVNSPEVQPMIRHFCTPMKPWNSNYQMVGNKVTPLANFDDFWHYAEMTPFYDEIKERYECGINKNPLTKRMSQIADKMKQD